MRVTRRQAVAMAAQDLGITHEKWVQVRNDLLHDKAALLVGKTKEEIYAILKLEAEMQDQFKPDEMVDY